MKKLLAIMGIVVLVLSTVLVVRGRAAEADSGVGETTAASVEESEKDSLESSGKVVSGTKTVTKAAAKTETTAAVTENTDITETEAETETETETTTEETTAAEIEYDEAAIGEEIAAFIDSGEVNEAYYEESYSEPETTEAWYDWSWEDTSAEVEEVVETYDYTYTEPSYSSIGDQIVAKARESVGILPYSWGCHSLDPSIGADCSGFVYAVYAACGIDLGTYSSDAMATLGYSVSLEDARPGDIIVFKNGGHVGIYSGNEYFIHSVTEGWTVSETWLWYMPYTYTDIRRVY